MKSNGMRIFLGITLAIILFGLVNLGIQTFYPSPEYSDYCEDMYRPELVACDNKTECTDIQTLDAQNTCYDEYDEARDDYNGNIFYVLVVLGLILAVSALFQEKKLAFQIVGLGAGSSLIIEGIIRNLNDKVPALIAGIIVFIILAYFVNKKVEQ